jgi:PAS domain S-box-containing protein
MITKMERFPANNSNPVLTVGKNGILLYSNAAAEPLLHEWDVRVGEKLPYRIGDFVQKVISQNFPEIMETKVGKKVYLIMFHPFPEDECVNIYGFDCSCQKKFEEKYLESEAREMTNLELAEIIDAREIQFLMDDFYNLTHIPIGIIDLNGDILVEVGWQDICTKFHRIHPETCKHCVESDTRLSTGVSSGEYKPYKCKNNMWDIVTPIIVGGKHVGNIFLGQFFFEGELLDYEFFRSRARQYDFNEEEYIAALEKAPKLSEATVNKIMVFFMRLAHILSQLGYSNVKLTRTLAERDVLVKALQESENRYRMLFDHSTDAVILSDPRDGGKILSANQAACRMLGWSEKELIGKERDVMFDLGDSAPSAVLDELILSGSAKAQLVYRRKDGTNFPGEVSASLFTDSNGEPRIVITIRDITERKKVEKALEIAGAYNRSLIEASLDPLVTIGPDGKITDVNGATELVTGYSRKELIGTDFSDYFTEPEKARAGYKQVFIDGEVRDYPLEIQHRNGQITPVLYNASIYRSENGEIIGVFAAARDITERKKSEEALKKAYENLEEKVKERTVQLEKAYNSLKESEKGLAEAQKMAHIGNWDWNLVTNELYYSDELYRIFGLNPQELNVPFDVVLNYIHPDYREYLLSTINEALNGKQYAEVDFKIITADGRERIVRAQGKAVFDENNSPIRILGTVQDITESKMAEEKIQILASAVQSSSDAIITESLEGIITSWNKGAEEVYGYLAEEIVGGEVSILEPDKLKGGIKELIEKIKQGEQIQHYETFRSKKNGTIINVSLTLSPIFDSFGKFVAISVIARDITERKRVEEKLQESEEKYRNIVETANEGIFIIDSKTIVTYANKKMTDMLGYTLEEVIGREIWDFISEESKGIVKLNRERKLQGVNESYELKLIRKGGSSLWVLVSTKSFFDINGRFIGSVNMLTDITKRKEIEEALANVEIARKREIHHRIKNNLQVISSLLDLQAEKFNNREDIKDLEVLEAFRESQDRVKSIALIHKELYKGGGCDTLNFSSYIEELAENLFQTYKLGNTDLNLNMELEENIFFDMDIAVPLGMIVNELISNSLKHAFPGRNKGTIQIKLLKEENAGNKPSNDKEEPTWKGTKYTLIVSDDGVGISEKIDLKNSDTLGLLLVGALVDQLDGTIELKRDNGTNFIIRLNVKEKEDHIP